jgi:hypothetical protein
MKKHKYLVRIYQLNNDIKKMRMQMAGTFASLTVEKLIKLDWAQFEPYYTALEKAELTEATVLDWLENWTAVSDVRRSTAAV